MGNLITNIQAQKRNRNRVNIYLDDEYAFSLDRMAAAWLTIGKQINKEDIFRLQEKDEFETALNRALHFLSFRARSEKEMQTYLGLKGYDESQIERVIARLKEENLINDLDFAQSWLDSRQRHHPRSQSVMKYELRQKGVTESEIEEALRISDLDDLELALKVGRKLFPRYQNSDKMEFDRKLAAALQRRGFTFSIVKDCLSILWKEKSECSGVD